MGLTIPNTFASGGIIDPDTVNENFRAIKTKLSGNITNEDIAADAAIDITKTVANHTITFILHLHSAMLAAGWPAAGATTPLVAVGIPGTAGDDAYTIKSAMWVCTDCGAGTAQFDLRYGYVNAATGAWTNSSTIISAETITGAANSLGAGTVSVSGSITPSTNHDSLAIMSAAADATTLSAAGTYLAVMLTCTRTFQS